MMDAQVPEGWVLARMSDVTEPVPNAKPEDEPDGTFNYVDISSIDNTTFTISELKQFKGEDAPSRARRPIRANDVLFSNVRTYLRNVALVPEGSRADLCSTGFAVLRPNGAVLPHYVFRYVLTDDFIDRVTPQQTGTHYPATSDRVVMGESIPVPPAVEQCRIVAKLEKLLAKVDNARERLEKVAAILKRFRQAVLAAACSGRLTADWREQNLQSASWKTSELLEVADQIQIGPFGTQLHRSDYVYNGVPLVNPTHIKNSKIVHDPHFSVSKMKYDDLKNYVLRQDDISSGTARRDGQMRHGVTTRRWVAMWHWESVRSAKFNCSPPIPVPRAQ